MELTLQLLNQVEVLELCLDGYALLTQHSFLPSHDSHSYLSMLFTISIACLLIYLILLVGPDLS